MCGFKTLRKHYLSVWTSDNIEFMCKSCYIAKLFVIITWEFTLLYFCPGENTDYWFWYSSIYIPQHRSVWAESELDNDFDQLTSVLRTLWKWVPHTHTHTHCIAGEPKFMAISRASQRNTDTPLFQAHQISNGYANNVLNHSGQH